MRMGIQTMNESTVAISLPAFDKHLQLSLGHFQLIYQRLRFIIYVIMRE
uniref:Uncharacterized protein n=1 Tax=Picea sitchensis TaxID=3332 RepID=A0A6B9XXW2_PICSI|nr:hypothetical protein Q903MT_gene6901 [Picea sitchensis]